MPLDYLLNDTPLNRSTHQNIEDLFNGSEAYFQDLREDKMANSLNGASTVCIVWKVPTKEGVQALKDFFEFHYTYMKEKSYQDGPLELIQYTISESPEYELSGDWHEGKFPKTTGRTIFTLFEIYRTPDGLHHHFIDGKDFGPELFEIATTYNIEFHLMNQMKVIQSLWD